MSIPALFLDRDGVINKDIGYIYKTEDIIFIEGIFDIVKIANKANYKVIIVTNQSGIGRGFFSEKDFEKLMVWMKNEFIANDCFIDDIYYCPFHPTLGRGKYLRKSNFRKPKPGMLLKAKIDHNIDMQKSILVGDNESDISAGQSAGLKNLIYFSDLKTPKGAISVRKLIQVKKWIV